MHTMLVIAGGLALLALFVIVARRNGRPFRTYLPWFVAAWLAAAAINMWVGVATAGYTVAEEFPIFLVVAGVPIAVAWLLARRAPN